MRIRERRLTVMRRQAKAEEAAVGPPGDTDGERRQGQITGITTADFPNGGEEATPPKKVVMATASKAGDWWTSAAPPSVDCRVGPTSH
ncbi:hypothetical protein LSTR_LSTR004412 [Laodelphax striatellus]|uniref:Uncharacterized protein n=1 Tax=Laodelphax striatellus TaxID=195883 RepID=A0A482X9S0_LAOST|nr:hypothetical protein LSTR_LSTR004412 [Laodelphax striatellus]